MKISFIKVSLVPVFLWCNAALNIQIAEAQTSEKTFRIANSKEVESLDPAFVDGGGSELVARGLYEGLTTSHPKTAEPVAGVAKSWTVSKDGLTYSFQLREDMRWSNGEKVTSADFLFAWKRMLDPETGAYYAAKFDDIKGAKAYRKAKAGAARDFNAVGIKCPDAQSIVVTLDKPVPYFLELLASSAFYPVPKSVVEKLGKNWARAENIVNNGPFLLASWKLKDRLTLTKNPQYYDAKNVKLDKIVVFPIEQDKTALNMYNAGEVDWIRRLPMGSVHALAGNRELHVNKLLRTVYLRLNTTRVPLKDAKVRRAISMAIDRKTLVEKVVKEGQSPALSFVTPGLKDYAQNDLIREDVLEAQKLLAEAGFPAGKGFPELTILHTPDELSKRVLTGVSVMLKKNLNINVSPKGQERGIFYDALDALKYDIARSDWSASFLDPKSFVDKFTSDNIYQNLTGYASPEFDELLTRSAQAKDPAERLALLAKAEEKLVAMDAPIVPLYFDVAAQMWKSSVSGLHENLLDIHPLKSIDIDEKMAKK
jgi:oligopeptide transport system substrate-binding protein